MAERSPVDVLLVSPGHHRRDGGGSTRTSPALLRELGLTVAIAHTDFRIARHLRRTMALTDLAEAAAMRRALTTRAAPLPPARDRLLEHPGADAPAAPPGSAAPACASTRSRRSTARAGPNALHPPAGTPRRCGTPECCSRRGWTRPPRAACRCCRLRAQRRAAAPDRALRRRRCARADGPLLRRQPGEEGPRHDRRGLGRSPPLARRWS